VDATIAAHPDEVQRFREGKQALIGFLVGQAMKRSAGAGDASAIRERMVAKLNG
jgi:aspartyl-tRNA(Asn)/glutamyl-tRNA(Gln) amidotransferase subunit B